ncbi:uncharacterized protein RHO25_007200 [Cercospora beticola]|nr:hypothetical protein RHO25_007200 [Cercospora beticola]
MRKLTKACRRPLRPSLGRARSPGPRGIVSPRTATYYLSTSKLQFQSKDPRQRYTAGLRPVIDSTSYGCGLLPDLANGLTYMHKWGFVIYRGTYGDEEQWETAIRWLYKRTLNTLQSISRSQDELDQVWKQLDLTVIEDRNLLESAPLHTVRELHRKWVLESPEPVRGGPLPEHWMQKVEAGGGDSLTRSDRYTSGPPGFPRYGYFVYIDDDALESIIAFRGQKNAEKEAYVRVVQTYYLDEPRPLHYEGPDAEEEMAVLESAEEPVEGIRRYEVGWMKYRALYLMDLYTRLHDTCSWDIEYKRPPELAPYNC